MSVCALILAGGRGTRFWPASTKRRPKHLLPLGKNGDTLLGMTVDRVAHIPELSRLFVVTNVSQYDMVEGVIAQRRGALSGIEVEILVESVGKNTAPCIALVAAILTRMKFCEVMTVFAADHYIQNTREFMAVISDAVRLAKTKNALITLGIEPSGPNTAYGYIELGEKLGDKFYQVRSFREKPDLATAEMYLSKGGYLWNSGMFIWRPTVIADEFSTYLPELWEKAVLTADAYKSSDFTDSIQKFLEDVSPLSIDYGILERSKNVIVINAGNIGWSDVGSWDSWGDLLDRDEFNNSGDCEKIIIDSKNCSVYSPDKLVALIGCEDLVVVSCSNGILVCKKDRVQEVRKVVEELEKKGKNELL